MEISLAKNFLINVNSKLISIQIIEQQQDDVLFRRFLEMGIYKLVTTELEVTIGDSKWIIPYQYIYEKESYDIREKDGPIFSLIRIRNLPFFKIEKKNNYVALIWFLINLDSFGNFITIDANKFNLIKVDDFITSEDSKQLRDLEKNYVIRLYKYIPQTPDNFYDMPHERSDQQRFIKNCWWRSPWINITGLNFPLEKIYDSEEPFWKSKYSINLLPETFISSFHKKIELLDEFWFFLNSHYHYKDFDGYSLYKGNYKDCRDIFNDEVKLSKLKKEGHFRNMPNWGEPPRYKNEDYFNAMTDGQLGDYSDFNAGSGNIDDIDTWARG